MAAVAVTSANTNTQVGGARVVVRTSTGIPYVVLDSGNDIDVHKGNSTTPTSFSNNGTGPSNSRYGQVSAAIDSSDIIHIAYYDSNGKNSALRYVTYNTSTDAFSGDVSIQDIGGATPSRPGTAIAIDANDIPHIAWVDSNSSMGSDYNTIYYTNKVGGSWNTAVEIEGVTANLNTAQPDIAIDADNIPVVTYGLLTGNGQVRAALGNGNNATSFSLFTVASQTIAVEESRMKISVAVDGSGNHHVAYLFGNASSDYDLRIRKHNYGDTWTSTWQTEEAIDNSFASTTDFTNGGGGALVIDGTDRYLFIEDPDTNDIVYYTDSSGSWSSQTTLETGTYNTAKAKWAFWVDNDSGGALISYGTPTTYYFDASISGPTDDNNVWANDSSFFDGSTSTNASVTSSDTSAYLRGTGTTAPTSGGSISKVRARIYTDSGSAVATVANVYHSGVLLNPSNITGPGASPNWGSWVTLTAPSGGWTWTKVNALEVAVRPQNSPQTYRAYRAEIEVTTFTKTSASELDYTFTDETASPDIWWNTLSIGTPATPDADPFTNPNLKVLLQMGVGV